ncbi:hypothetical protein [Methanocorpusculum vombati]|uniref:4Fe-4S ferredoxin-type domain-containing protein n=1 Tax=Methanocorpusculum vombati TaxID=3002864 RepID=A0ABT4IPU5_9EURY|nr:hypothetical protein [Methanocorpusculum vombati]MCZ0863145.1 hypothetical protein [Methanocorpusculum vombati]MCZ9319760.1 hypothetical protein [Methanocorpusculum sp.]MDE2548171.1 hypothetical protein [Methanocorpusculum sp.]
MRQLIAGAVSAFVRAYEMRPGIATRWGDPLVGFCDARCSAVRGLKCSVSLDHLMPEDVLAGASVVVVYFLPFTPELAETNCSGTLASPAWARAYAETNALFAELNDQLVDLIRSRGGRAEVPGAAAGFAEVSLMSRWSHRHFAVLAGLGTFGMNNMLITRAGCCGRVSSFAAEIAVEPDVPLSEELCLFRRRGACGRCFVRCPSGALSPEGFDRWRCFGVCLENAGVYSGCDVCGKCVTGVPCSFWCDTQK